MTNYCTSVSIVRMMERGSSPQEACEAIFHHMAKTDPKTKENQCAVIAMKQRGEVENRKTHPLAERHVVLGLEVEGWDLAYAAHFDRVLLAAVGAIAMARYSLSVGLWWLIWPIILQGFGMGLVFVPLTTLAFATLRPDQTAEAAGLRQLIRTIAASTGTAASTGLTVHFAQQDWNQLGGYINPFNPALLHYFSHLHLFYKSPLAAQLLGRLLDQQSQMTALIHVFELFGMALFATIPLLLLIKRGRAHLGITGTPQKAG